MPLDQSSFTIKLMVLPPQKSSNYGVILGEESMRALDIVKSVRNNMISWSDKEIPMVPREYWTEERILHHKMRLSKQLPIGTNVTGKAPTEESNATEALQAVTYEKANLKDVTQRCINLSAEQQSKLLTVLKDHEQLFLGCRGEWKGTPVSIKVIKRAMPNWAKPYPVPLKNHQVF
jgi:hypothetical protein